MSEQKFGLPIAEFRTDYGTLKSRELEKITSHLNRRGILLATCFDRKIVIVNPYLVNDVKSFMDREKFEQLLIGATVANIREKQLLNLAQNRVLEALTPGAIIVCDNNKPDQMPAAVPDNLDLRDLCSVYGGTLQVFVAPNNMNEQELCDMFTKMDIAGFNLNTIGILEYPYYDEDPNSVVATVVSITDLNNVHIVKKGIYNSDVISLALNTVSCYEIGEWT